MAELRARSWTDPGLPVDEGPARDPLATVAELVAHDAAPVEQVQVMLRDCLIDQAMDGDGRPLLIRSADGVRCHAFASGERHRRRFPAPAWERVDLTTLVVRLPDDVDVLLNPGGRATLRLCGDFVREAWLLSDEEAAAALRPWLDAGEG